MKSLVVFSGAGISAESGLKTFRDNGGLWEEFDIMEVATPQAWDADQQKVLEFYNQRKTQATSVKPNAAHFGLAELEKKYDVQIITQNIDNLHEAAGSSKVLHLHGEITKARSTLDESLLYEFGAKPIEIGDLCEKGSQLRPHIVWFGEDVPNMDIAIKMITEADILVIIGTSLNVYPAAGLVDYAEDRIPKYLIDPADVAVGGIKNLTFIKEKASEGISTLANQYL